MQLLGGLKPLHSLHPGEWYFGNNYERLHTVLGSCVALSSWHPHYKIGGMCHYLLPLPPGHVSSKQGDCRYALNALEQMKKSMLACAPLDEYRIGIFGGGNMFSFVSPRSVGYENILYARQWLAREKVQLFQSDVGGRVSRSVILVLATGEIQLKRYDMNT
ncbi:chemotaxis protein CheD [Cellvibrio japonicus]|uniref:Probable chemoreceptor glutamine deamidase CheD n=1 Tax=Cellvibrio japonicus (strain Ueda107) TaxID=498211 RepID=B3PCN2_CELJU|nr:chemotaxis protein CheD [Cellvibrio japonicus]ACE83589.1 putative cheB, glutamate methylesterase [Cellvibrio japonicus Ueda107]QEI13255.1 chemotaxis protein CheD [Cellvibrio japonicus]QEI16829.1 chemotaxis protein CheD [Cellvibrio japonicus]QEI20407.1 chemotaxis protein CheD [Cellvibrio japonicus]